MSWSPECAADEAGAYLLFPLHGFSIRLNCEELLLGEPNAPGHNGARVFEPVDNFLLLLGGDLYREIATREGSGGPKHAGQNDIARYILCWWPKPLRLDLRSLLC